MMILELDKKYCREQYKGNKKQMIEQQDGLIWDDERIRHAFSFGHGTEKDLRRYINDNKCYAWFYDMQKQCYI